MYKGLPKRICIYSSLTLDGDERIGFSGRLMDTFDISRVFVECIWGAHVILLPLPRVQAMRLCHMASILNPVWILLRCTIPLWLSASPTFAVTAGLCGDFDVFAIFECVRSHVPVFVGFA